MKLTREFLSRKVLLAALSLLLASACGGDVPRSYQERRAGFQTRLRVKGPTPQDGVFPIELFPGDWSIPAERVREVRYPSGELKLRAWVYVPNDGEKRPAVVYLHPGLLGNAGTLRQCRPFLDAGFVVMLPTYRGEIENPGHYEMFFGEVDDAAAAVRWIAEQPYVDRDRVYAFGFSAGGIISGLISLVEDIPLRHSGGVGGVVEPKFKEFAEIAPFDPKDLTEWGFRFLQGNVRWMKRKHIAYAGTTDAGYGTPTAITKAKQEIAEGGKLLEIVMVPGDHASSAPAAMELYLRQIEHEGGE